MKIGSCNCDPKLPVLDPVGVQCAIADSGLAIGGLAWHCRRCLGEVDENGNKKNPEIK